MSEDYSRTGNALSGRLSALPALGFLLVALELALTAGKTPGSRAHVEIVQRVCGSVRVA